MDYIWILFAFLFGLAMRSMSLPPLIGYLAAGFVLHFMGHQAHEQLDQLADLGITLLLFTVGLKINIRDLAKPEVLVGSVSHMATWIILLSGLFLLLAALSLPLFNTLDPTSAALLAFAFSFSSTVCVVKLLEENGEMKTRHGKLAIAILVIQDLFAVAFLVAATGKTPSIWALGLLLLIPARPLLGKLVTKSGHGELLPLTGFFLALGGYQLFELVNIKGDLGALIAGMLLSQLPKANELTKSLLSFKDLFLIGFFLSIGFTALPDWSMLAIATVIAALLPLKFLLFFRIFTGLKLRARSAYLTSLALANFSEFGLIVVALSVEASWLPKEWLVILALAVSLSFVFTSVIYRLAHVLYSQHKSLIKVWERATPLPQDILDQPKTAEILVIGMGRVGRGAFEALYEHQGDKVWGMDADRDRIQKQQQLGYHVFCGDGEDADLWERIDTSDIKLVMLCLPIIDDTVSIADQLRSAGYKGQIAAIARYEDEGKILVKSGIDKVFNFFTEAGTGFAEESMQLILTDNSPGTA